VSKIRDALIEILANNENFIRKKKAKKKTTREQVVFFIYKSK